MKTDNAYDPNYVYKRVDAQNLEWSTADGWELVDSFDETTQRFEWNDVPVENSSSGGYYNTRREPVLGAPLTTRFFLVRRKRGEVNTIEALRAELREKECSTTDLERQLEATKEECKGWKKDLDALRSDNQQALDRLRSVEKTKRNAERDLAKARAAIGTQQWDAIFKKKDDDDD